MDHQLQELIELQRERNQLLRHLVRIRFSLWALLVITTLTGAGLGVYALVPASPQPTPRIFPIRIIPPPTTDAEELGAPRVGKTKKSPRELQIDWSNMVE